MALAALPLTEPAVFAGAALVALLVDRVLGEPSAPWHPVVWMGRYLDMVGRWIARQPARAPDTWARRGTEFLGGALGWVVGALMVLTLALGVSAALADVPTLLQALFLGLLLKPMLAWRMLRDEVMAVEQALAVSLEAGRQQVGRLVSRDVRQLDTPQVREAALSTLAENLNDSVVAPLLWFAVAGLPGAALYRFANTADAMWGYRGERLGRDWTWAGKWSARADDVLSWWPARLSAVLLALPVAGRGLSGLADQARLTPSPNGGWPMAALALGLGIRLGKPGVYALNASGRVPGAADTARALRLCGQAVGLLALVAAAAAALPLARSVSW